MTASDNPPGKRGTPGRLPIYQLFALHGKTAICTGSTGGIGKELCITLAEAGCDIVSIQIPNDSGLPSLERGVKALNRRFTAFDCDIGDSQGVRECFAKIWVANIEADILVNAAGINKRGALTKLTDIDIDTVLDINLKGSFVAAQEMAKRLLSLEKPGKIINIGSMTSFIGMYDVSAYAASKGGVLQMTKAFSNELAEKGIQVNCICPGYIDTPLTVGIRQNPDYEAFVLSRTPAKRWGTPQDLRRAVVFLASSASDFVTGTSIIVDGGMLGK
ncbi:hypothetical protein Q7P37_007768 [Cladosporium fusiforme]